MCQKRFNQRSYLTSDCKTQTAVYFAFSCWVFSQVSISVAHEDALQLGEALCVNGAD